MVRHLYKPTMKEEDEILDFEEWWGRDASRFFVPEAKEAARYTWNHVWTDATRMLKELNL